ncbi:BON domain-containing protein [Paraburkholderia phymatum]|uniref:BON domain-containing protein n=1 Tax=Paraburkholderia phymatum TaxID=148447 RepID=UPI00316DB8CB
MKTLLGCVAAAAAGAVAMFHFDRQSGRRRRAMLHDKVTASGRKLGKRARAQARRIAGRVYGTMHEAVSSAPTSDVQLVERVRSRLGRVVSNPKAVDISAEHSHVCVSGNVLAAERARMIRAINAVSGVEHVDDHLSVYDGPGKVPELQGIAGLRH